MWQRELNSAKPIESFDSNRRTVNIKPSTLTWRPRFSSWTVNMQRIWEVLSRGPDSPNRVHNTHSSMTPAHDTSRIGWDFTAISFNTTKAEKRGISGEDNDLILGCEQVVCKFPVCKFSSLRYTNTVLRSIVLRTDVILFYVSVQIIPRIHFSNLE